VHDLSALVLTAGLGTRLDPITRVVAKAAVPLGSSTLIEHVLTWLARQGIRRTALNLHHRPASIAAAVGDGGHLGLAVRYSWEYPLLGSAGGPRHALPLIDSDPFLIVNGDTLCDVDLAAMLDAHRASGADVTMAVIPNPAPDQYNGIMLDEHDRVIGFVPRGQADGSWHFIGVQIVRTAVFDGLADGVPAETVAGIYRDRLRAHPGSIAGYRGATMFLDIGTPRDYLDTALILAARESSDGTGGRIGDRANQRSASVPPSARITDSIVWPTATIGPGAHLERCIVIGDVSVPVGFQARSAVIAPARLQREDDARAILEDGVLRFEM
jgi:mannose-1-phosphate guanylyltransferase